MIGSLFRTRTRERDTLSELRDAASTQGHRRRVAEPGTIDFHNVTKTVGNGALARPVLSDVNARFERGRFVGILGAKGSGKTNLVSLLNGNSKPDEGEVLHGMSVSWAMSSREVFNKTLSVRTNVRFFSEMYGAWTPGMLDAVAELGRLKRSDLDKPLREAPDEVHNRAVICMCYALRFECYVADEILCRGSREFREYMMTFLRRCAASIA